MVRVFPLFRSLVPHEWAANSEGFPAVMVKVQSDALNQAQSQIPVLCRHAHPRTIGIFYGQNPLEYTFTLVLLEMSLVILITRVVRFLLKPLRQPRIVSEIIGGIIIGPSILGRNKTFAANVFPDNGIFVLRNIGVIGFMYFLFVSGVKMDLTIIMTSGRKQWWAALIGVLLPTLTVFFIALILRPSLDRDLAKFSSIGAVSSALAITAFPVLHPILKELNLLSSEVGRLALSTAVISDVVGINAVIAFEAAKQGEVESKATLWYLISLIAAMAFILGGIRRVMAWIIRKTPEGKPVDQMYVIAILLGVMSMGFMTDMFGAAVANGPLWLGLAIPDGPPLGATLVDKSETIIMELLMPFSFAYVGLYTDVFAMRGHWSSLSPLFVMTVSGYVAKLVATLITSRFFELPFRDGLAFGLIMSLRGQVEMLLFIHWMDYTILKKPSFTMMVLLTTTVTAIAAPLITVLYDPTRPYMINKRRTIQHTAPNTELQIVACIHDQQNVAALINLLEVSNPTQSSPFSVYALRLVELVGRASPVFIEHEKQEESYEPCSYDTIHHALKLYQEARDDLVKIHSFTAVSPLKTMYQDVCKLAIDNKATLIILPFHKECLDIQGRTELVRHGVQSVNQYVLAHAPSSVGVLVDKGAFRNHLVTRSSRHSTHHFAVLFLGGPDAREALSYADRMAGDLEVSLTVIRFLSYNYEGDDEMEKKLDDGLVTWFWVKNEGNDRVIYKEMVVRNGEETVTAIHAMNGDSFNLWILGRKQGINPVLLEGLADWSENRELGVIGDYVASMDFSLTASVLVMQQQVLRGQRDG